VRRRRPPSPPPDHPDPTSPASDAATRSALSSIAGDRTRQQIGLVLHRRRATPPPCRQRHYIEAATSSAPPQHPETPPGTSTRSIQGECIYCCELVTPTTMRTKILRVLRICLQNENPTEREIRRSRPNHNGLTSKSKPRYSHVTCPFQIHDPIFSHATID
jgi:hypothetical protein